METVKRPRGRPRRPPSVATGFRLPADLLRDLVEAAASESRRLGYNVYVNGLVVRACRDAVERCKTEDMSMVLENYDFGAETSADKGCADD